MHISEEVVSHNFQADITPQTKFIALEFFTRAERISNLNNIYE